MKKRFSVIFILLAFMMIVSGTIKTKYVFAEGKISDFDNFTCKSAYLTDSETNTVIFSKDETKRLPIASMCKIMTLLLCFEEIDNGIIDVNDIISVSDNASKMGGSQIFLESNGKYKVNDLIKGIVVASANDACVALAEHISGSEHEFVIKMNDKAESLGMDNTLFSNCTGLPKPGQYSCAKDVAKMFSELIKHEKYFDYSTIWTDTIVHPKDRVTEISNTNKLVRFYNGCDGGKTGYTNEAGHCVCSSAKRDDLRLISVVVGAQDSKSRFSECSKMFNYGFANYCNKLILDKTKPVDVTINVSGGKSKTASVVPSESVNILCKKTDKRCFEFDYVKNSTVIAPINVGDVLGKIIIYENGVEFKSVSLVANESIKKAGYFDVTQKVIDNMQMCK